MCMNPVKIKVPDSELGIFNKYTQSYINVPCGKCDECRVSHAKEWSVRCMCELLSRKNKENCWFVTFTYDKYHNPGVLSRDDMTLFWKRLRKHFKNDKIKYFYCGEYGSITYRPHYHAIIYGLNILDLQRLKSNLFTSPTLESIWGRGMVAIGFVSLQSCNYVARYALKKNNSDCYIRMSQGFGKNYFLKHMRDIISNGYITLPKNDKIVKCSIPRYFLKIYRKLVGDKEYSRYLKFRAAAYKKYSEEVLKKFHAPNDSIGYLNRRKLAIPSNAEKLAQISKNILNESLYEFYKFRDIIN